MMKINSADQLYRLFHDIVIKSDKWESSALQLDENLESIGINVPKFYNKYALPLPKEQLERISDKMMLFTKSAHYVDEIERLRDEYLDLSHELYDEVAELADEMTAKATDFAAVIKHDNPTLSHIQTPTVQDKIHLIRGAVYGYPPENIELFIKDYERLKVFSGAVREKEIEKLAGFELGLLRLTNKQRDMLLTALKARGGQPAASRKPTVEPAKPTAPAEPIKILSDEDILRIYIGKYYEP